MPTTTSGAVVTHCDRCHRPFSDFATPITTGYGRHTNAEGDTEYLCFACCADEDRKEMREAGKIMLYLTDGNREVTNWPGTLRYAVREVRRSRHHTFGGDTERIDVWFRDEVGNTWHGVHRGHNNTVVRCQRLTTHKALGSR